MKLATLLLLFIVNTIAAQVGIGTTNPDSSAALDITSTTKGFLPPRVTQNNMLAIPAPAQGLLVYCLDCVPEGLHFYNGSSWQSTASNSTENKPLLANVVLDFESTLVGARLTTQYTYLPNGVGDENPAATVYTWYRASDKTGTNKTLIKVDNLGSYIIQSGDINSWISVEVSAISVTGKTSIPIASSFIPAQMIFNGAIYSAVRGVYDGNDANLVGDYIWLDRNIGAIKVAASSTDAAAYGGYFQWGRLTDGHQLPSSTTTTTLSPTITPAHGNFIASSGLEWTAIRFDNMWSESSGYTNNVCPDAFMVPTNVQWENERVASGLTNFGQLFNNRLKLTVAGIRNNNTGLFSNVNSQAYYWTSTVIPGTNYGIFILATSNTTATTTSFISKASGLPCRCVLKN